MLTDLQRHIEATPLCDTHEHLRKEHEILAEKPDVLREIFENYVSADLRVAGATQAQVDAALWSKDLDVAARFAPLEEAWRATRFTGYGEASRYIAKRFFGIEELSGRALAKAQELLPERWPEGDRMRVLRDEARLDHVQVDDFCWPCQPDASGPEFFLYDISWLNFCAGDLVSKGLLREGESFSMRPLFDETGVEVKDLGSLREAMEKLFEKYAPCAIAVKAQHAYMRTLAWRERSDEEAAAVLEAALAGRERSEEEKNVLGDWCWARGAELAAKHNLPFKLHTGYYAGHSRMPVSRIAAGQLCPLLARYPETRWVLMHIAYPYDDEIVALAKHYPNVWVDFCWAWSINPLASMNFLRRYLHAAPINKLFAFGGDTGRPRAAAAYAMQARKWLNKALQAEVDDRELSEAQALEVVDRLFQRNARACFDLDGVRARIRERLGVPPSSNNS